MDTCVLPVLKYDHKHQRHTKKCATKMPTKDAVEITANNSHRQNNVCENKKGNKNKRCNTSSRNT